MKFKSMNEVWDAVLSGKTVYWTNKNYKVFVEPDLMPEVTKQHNARRAAERNGSILCIRYINNHFVGILEQSELGSLFVD